MPSVNTNDTGQYVTIDGDVLDAIIFRIYGKGPSALAIVMDANPHIRALPVHLPVGTCINLPALPEDTPPPRVRLWD